VTDPARMPVREARPRSLKPPRWSAERRASRVISAFTRVLTRYGTQGASQAPDTPRHGVSNGCRCPRTSLGAPPPLDSGWRSKDAKPGRKKCAAGTRWAVLKTKRYAARDVRPHPEERVCKIVPPTRTRVRASRRMRTSKCIRPHASRRIAARFQRWKDVGPRGAAVLLSMRAGGGAFWRDAAGRVLSPGEVPTCGCRKRAPTRAPCFRPVLYREDCN
jgi:hypothetical protein